MKHMNEIPKTLKKLASYDKLTKDDIEKRFLKCHSASVTVEKNDKCHGGFKITCGEKRFFITETPINTLNEKWWRATKLQEKALDVSIPLPLFVGQGNLSKKINEILKSQTPKESTNEWLKDIFSVEIAVSYFNNHFKKSQFLQDKIGIILESIEAFYLGLDHISIMSLLPVYESYLRDIQSYVLGTSNSTVSSEDFNKGMKNLILDHGNKSLGDYDWHPGKGYNMDIEIDFFTHFNRQCDIINTARIFFKEIIYQPSSGVSGNGFNRHLILHLLKNDFKEPSNYIRIFISLTHLAFIESLYNTSMSSFWSEIQASDKPLSEYIRSRGWIFMHRRDFLKSSGIEIY